MSVAQYYPFNGSKNRLRMGLSSIQESSWIEYEDDYTQRILEKKHLISQQRDRVLQSTDGSEAAQNDLLNNILLFIKQYQNDLFTINDDSIVSHRDNVVYKISDYKSCPLELISYLAPDDFCILEKLNDDYRLVAASVCAPTYWELLEKIGKPMKGVHAPIAGLEDKIGRMIRHFFMNLKPDDYYQRSNWFLMTTSDLTLFKDHYGSDNNIGDFNINNIMDKLFLRCERQSFRKLEQTENIVFGIKIYVSPLSIVSRHTEIAEDLTLALNSMTTDQRKLLGIEAYEDVLMEYLNNLL